MFTTELPPAKAGGIKPATWKINGITSENGFLLFLLPRKVKRLK
jgi:hypothetical protein